ncbi:MAG: prepilin-type N-terminal cleavage/methylation domain-containing protein [Gammaproteobacteria bacterium]|nr:prepilin-type N-terminal cleavage/methylation domain-containing protein [Gammaproteobacteria bacterium]
MRYPTRHRGATLIELVISISIIAVSLTGVMMVVANTTRTSADPMIRTQALSIANAYLEEILSQALSEPSGGDVGGPEAGESRATFDDVTDYDGLDDSSGAIDQYGNLIADLAAYNVAVSVTPVTLGTDPAQRITVTVTLDGNAAFGLTLNAYRLN